MGAPWYRSTRVVHLVSGADYGWRGVTGAWPPYFPDRADNAVAVCDIGKGSPTAVKFGTHSRFPRPYQQALYILDWAYGRIIAVHLDAHGAGYRARAETFVRGQPLNVTDLDFGPDGDMYVVSGGRKTQSALYRIRYVGPQTNSPVKTVQQREREAWSHTARESRRTLEAMHQPHPDAIASAWKWLGHPDPALRYAARIAVEHQPVNQWRDRALSAGDSLTGFTALMALARSGDVDVFSDVLKQLNQCDLTRCNATQMLIVLRTYGLCLQSDSIDSQLRSECRKALAAVFPQRSAPSVTAIGWPASTNRELSRLLLLLDDTTATETSVVLMQNSTTTNDRLHYLHNLRTTGKGWTMQSRRAWFVALNDAARYPGGRGLPGFLNSIRADGIATLSEVEQNELADLLESAPGPDAAEPLPQREFVKDWKAADLAESLNAAQAGRNFRNGRQMFHAALCNRCHRVGLNGSAFGPDLTSVGGRFSPRDILQSILDPSAVIAEPYRSVDIITADGRSLSGQVITSGDYRARSIRIIPDPLHPAKTIEIQKHDIEEHRVSTTSPMPKSLLNTLRRDDVFDLLAYLISGGNKQHPAFQTEKEESNKEPPF
jgi:putative heme-binding domain-containing protein